MRYALLVSVVVEDSALRFRYLFAGQSISFQNIDRVIVGFGRAREVGMLLFSEASDTFQAIEFSKCNTVLQTSGPSDEPSDYAKFIPRRAELLQQFDAGLAFPQAITRIQDLEEKVRELTTKNKSLMALEKSSKANEKALLTKLKTAKSALDEERHKLDVKEHEVAAEKEKRAFAERSLKRKRDANSQAEGEKSHEVEPNLHDELRHSKRQRPDKGANHELEGAILTIHAPPTTKHLKIEADF